MPLQGPFPVTLIPASEEEGYDLLGALSAARRDYIDSSRPNATKFDILDGDLDDWTIENEEQGRALLEAIEMARRRTEDPKDADRMARLYSKVLMACGDD